MKGTKKFFPLFSFYDRTGIENYLEEKASKGFMLEKITGFGWKFRKTEPKKVNYAVTYFPKASAFDPEPTEEQLEFREFCEHTGWVFASGNAQMQVYYNEGENPVHIETDALIELENIHASAKKSFLPAQIILLINGLMQAGMFFARWKSDPVEILVNDIHIFSALCWVMILILCGTEICSYFSWYKRAKKAAEKDGSFLDTKSRTGFQLFIIAIMLMGLGAVIAGINDGFLAKTVIYTFTGVIAVTAMVAAMSEIMKKMKVPKKVNGFVTYASAVLMGVAFAVGIILMVVGSTGTPGHDPVSTYEWGLMEIEVYDDDIPLKLEDLSDEYTSYDRYSYECYPSSSFIASRYDCAQEPHISDSDDVPSLRYAVYEVKVFAVYDTLAGMIFDDIAKGYNYEGEIIASLESVDPSAFLAERAYRVYYRESEPINRYLLYYPKTIVDIRTERELTTVQMNIIGHKLGYM